jgi:hypothetical protein
MIKSKINPDEIKDLKWKEYVKLFQKDIQTAENKGAKKVPVVMISDFTFACGETHALVLLGKQSVMTKFFKSLKADDDRKKLKDFSIGLCHFEKEADGTTAIKIGISGFGKPAKMKKNSKKLIQKLGIKLKDIIKGEYVDEVFADINAENKNASVEELATNQALQNNAEELKANDDSANDNKKLGKVAKEFSKANKLMNKEVVSLLKLAKSETVVYTDKHVKIAEEAFRATASLVDRYEEVAAKRKNLAKTALKITVLKDNIVEDNLVKKYETIWKKVNQEYNKQMNKFSEPLRMKFDELNSLLEGISQETAQ